MLNDRDRDLLKDLERHLEKEDPAWLRQFERAKPARRARRSLVSETALGLLILLTAICLVLGASVAAVIFGFVAIAVAHVRYT
jgi:hypothetical protein